MIGYDLIAKAVDYYKAAGYEYIEVPWVVGSEAINITAPRNCQVNHNSLVGSGEQSFLQMLLDKKLERGKYCCATPCYRPQDGGKNDGLHFSQFFKIELIDIPKPPSYTDGDSIPNRKNLRWMISDAKLFMESTRREFLKEALAPDNDPRECFTFINYDILTQSGIELGSYGVRRHDSIGTWIYGTGAAFPRLMYGVQQ